MRKAVPDDNVTPGMIVTLPDCPGEKYEVIAIRGNEKQLLRREDLETVKFKDIPPMESIHGFPQDEGCEVDHSKYVGKCPYCHTKL